jgi:dienelactone hydrolase
MRAAIGRRAALLLPALIAGRAMAAAPLPPGSHAISFAETCGAVPGPMAVYLHRPAAWRPDGPIVVVMHGVQRNADGYRDAWVAHAEAGGFLLVCPCFDGTGFPGDRWYNLGNAVDAGGVAQPPEAWSFAALDHAVDAARAACGGTRADFALYGHSAGAQFVHRYLLLTHAPRVSRLIVANAGWYSMPRWDVAFPYGLGGTRATETELAAALGRPVTILLGEADRDPNHPQLRRDTGSDAQGTNRFDRGHAFFAAAREAAARLGVGFAWRLQTVPGVAHSNAGMAVAAAPLLAG